MEEKFLMVSLEEEKSRKLAQVISNPTSRRILNYLGSKKASETEISKELRIPLSTVHYNVKGLVKAGLVEAKDFFWSDKGNKIWVYNVAKKAVIIAPKASGFLQEIKKLSFVSLIALVAGGVVSFFSKSYFGKVQMKSAEMTTYAESLGMERAVGASETVSTVMGAFPNYGAMWFLIGAGFVILVYFLISLIRRGRK